MNIRYLALALTLGLGIMGQQATAAVAVAKNAMVTLAVLGILATQYETERANVDQLMAIECALTDYSRYNSERTSAALSGALSSAGLTSKLSDLQNDVVEFCPDTAITEDHIATMREHLEKAKTAREKLDSEEKAIRHLAAKKRAIQAREAAAKAAKAAESRGASPDGDRVVSPAGAPVVAPAAEGWTSWIARGFGLFGTGTNN